MTTKAISTKDISELRARTGAGISDCKNALVEAAGDMERATEILRMKGISKAEKRAGRTASQGIIVIEAMADGSAAAMVELNCETDFVARTDDFTGLARELAVHALGHASAGSHPGSALDAQPFGGSTVAEVVKAVSGKTGEAMTVNRVARFQTTAGTVQRYLHHNGQVGVLVEVEGPRGEALDALAKEVALHVASADPLVVSEADIPAETLERERRIETEKVAQEGKPENMQAKIVEGKIRKFVAQSTLLEQPFVKDEKKTVGALVAETAKAAGGAVTVKRFARFKVGEA
jgi:elongation factor Ts